MVGGGLGASLYIQDDDDGEAKLCRWGCNLQFVAAATWAWGKTKEKLPSDLSPQNQSLTDVKAALTLRQACHGLVQGYLFRCNPCLEMDVDKWIWQTLTLIDRKR